MGVFSEFTKGLYRQNPVFRIALGLCPTLAVSNSIKNGIGMGLAASFVLVGSNVIVSLIRKAVPIRIRIPMFIVVIATFVTIGEMVMQAVDPELHKSLGIFVPLIVVNCIILGRAEAFASKNGAFRSALDGLGMGVGFTLALVSISLVRELLGSGKLLDVPVLGTGFQPVLLMILPPGAFFTLGMFLGFFNWLESRKTP